MQTSILNRGVQFALAVIVLVISVVVFKKSGSLSDTISELNILIKSNNETSIIDLIGDYGFNLTGLDTGIKKRDGSLFNQFDNITMASNTKPILISLLSGSLTSGSHTTMYGSRVMRLTPPSNIGSQTSWGVSKSQLLYLTSLVGSEAGSVGLWFTSSIYQASMYGNWQCDSVQSLLINYNLTDSSYPDSILENFFGITNGNFEPLSSGMGNFTTINTNNLTTLMLQSELLLKLSNDCQMRKATLSISVIGSLTYFLSSGIMATSAYTFFKGIQQLKTKKSNTNNSMISLVYDDPMNFPTVEEFIKSESDAEIYFDSV